MIIFNQFKHLLPRARAWRVTVDKQLRQFIQGLANGLEDDVGFDGPVTFFDNIYGDLLPQTTRELDMWEQLFGLPPSTGLTEQQRRDRLAAAWQATGGQSPRYIQDTLQANGFPVFIHDWWVPATDTPRDPNSVVSDPAKILINKIEAVLPKLVGYGTEYQAGDTISIFGEQDGVQLIQELTTLPVDSINWPFFVYFGGEVFGTTVNIPMERRDEFEALCLKLCPTQLWIGLIVNYV